MHEGDSALMLPRALDEGFSHTEQDAITKVYASYGDGIIPMG